VKDCFIYYKNIIKSKKKEDILIKKHLHGNYPYRYSLPPKRGIFTKSHHQHKSERQCVSLILQGQRSCIFGD